MFAHPPPDLQDDALGLSVDEKRKILGEAIEAGADDLLRAIGALLARMGVFERSGARSRGDIAGDVLGDACAGALRAAERFDARREPLPWVWGFALNAAKRQRDDIFKANRAPHLKPEVSASDIASRTPDEEQSAEEALEVHAAHMEMSMGLLHARRPTLLETQQALDGLLAPLAPSEREVIVLSVFEEFDSKKLAERLNIEPPAARKRLERARARLRAHIRDHAGEFEWIENLPALFAQENKDAISCHTRLSMAQHPPHDSPARFPTALRPGPTGPPDTARPTLSSRVPATGGES